MWRVAFNSTAVGTPTGMWTQALSGGPGGLLRIPVLLAGASTNLANVWRPASGGPGRLRTRTPNPEQQRLRRDDRRQGTKQASQQEKKSLRNDGLRQVSASYDGNFAPLMQGMDARIQEMHALIQDKDAALTRALEEKKKIEERTDAALTRALEDKDARIQEKDAALTRALEDKDALLKSVREQLGEKLNATIIKLARHRAVIDNRVILEIGLRKYHEKWEGPFADFVFSRAWARLRERELQYVTGKWDVPKDVLDNLRALGCDASVDIISKELVNLHAISLSHHHHLDHPDPGFCIGGIHKSLGCAVAIAVLRLQKLGCFAADIRYLDIDGTYLYLLRRGHVMPPVCS